ncbi:hypothetical protein ACQP2F_27410 [Actinoplanes sp. CA-030573]|uniref:hypothetical protein n=1 Tax=Actinoplanes sp. CA-030573 TaxID=3239898 RepID=UPI003D8E2061
MTPIGDDPFEPGEFIRFEPEPGGEGEGPDRPQPVPARPACRPQLLTRRDGPPRR